MLVVVVVVVVGSRGDVVLGGATVAGCCSCRY